MKTTAKEYIERDKLVGLLLDKIYKCTSSSIDYGEIIYLINSQPAADVQEVRRTRWEYFFDIEEMARCSNCYEVLEKGRASCYCPHCGAKMDKE